MGIGFNDKTMEREEYLKDIAFYYYDEYGSSKLEHYKECFQRENSEIADLEEITIPVGPTQTGVSSAPMDSPWPTVYHDNNHTGRSPYSTVDTCAEKWRFYSSGWVEDTPVIDSDGIIYFGGAYNYLDDYLFAVYPDGTEKWKFQTGGLILGSSPAIAEDGTVYVGSWDTKLYAINPNGTLKWRIGTGGSVTSSTVIGDDGTIYIGNANGRIFAVNPNGTKKWHYDTGDYIASDPAIGYDRTVYIGSLNSYLYALYPNGTLRWRFKTGDRIYGSPSIAEDGTIYIGSSWDSYLYALYPNGTLKWKYGGAGTPNNPSIGNDGTIYAGYMYKLVALNPDGTLKWGFDIGNGRFIGKSAPAISADGIIYFGIHLGTPGHSTGGEIIAVNPDGTERWRKKIANKWVESSPAIAEDGTVYIGCAYAMSEGYLFAFGIGELEADADGPYYGIVDEPVQFAGSHFGGYSPHSYHWDFGDGDSSDEQNPMHTYTYPSNFTVTLTVTDNSSNTSDDTTWAWIQESNDPPNKPIIDGETNGKVGQSYDYTFETTDPEGLQVWYYIEWGDDSNTGWLGPYSSGEQITKSHTWSEKDTYTIRCKAKDPYGAEGEWGELEVTMPMNQQTNNMWFIQFLQNHPRMFPILKHLLGL